MISTAGYLVRKKAAFGKDKINEKEVGWSVVSWGFQTGLRGIVTNDVGPCRIGFRRIRGRILSPRFAMQSQLVCSGCRSILLYPRGATNVCCALCSTITAVPPPGMEMAQLYCGGCRTLLMYTRGASSVRCSCCHTVNLAQAATNQFAHINCGNCRTVLMYPYGAPSVKCALCQYVTNAANPPRTSIPPQRPESAPSTSTSSQTVVVENPMSVDESGKLVTNVVVGVTTEKKSPKKTTHSTNVH